MDRRRAKSGRTNSTAKRPCHSLTSNSIWSFEYEQCYFAAFADCQRGGDGAFRGDSAAPVCAASSYLPALLVGWIDDGVCGDAGLRAVDCRGTYQRHGDCVFPRLLYPGRGHGAGMAGTRQYCPGGKQAGYAYLLYRTVRVERAGGGADCYGGCEYGYACSRGGDAGNGYFAAGAMVDYYYYPEFAGGAGRGGRSDLFGMEAGTAAVEPGWAFDEQYPVGQCADPGGGFAERSGGDAGEVPGTGEYVLAGDVAGLGFVPGGCAA